ncbi:UPF0176 protein [Porphyridium purpureum]|uniref:UPF0176 protein n=1 Tax=Porphyridium purpureum TaxID=35688 RepID=A0A5J4Z204_PORPP|nr:UPF0176 protein [Porphyridium purpureum]|eukprot:POR2037..scf295_1
MFVGVGGGGVQGIGARAACAREWWRCDAIREVTRARVVRWRGVCVSTNVVRCVLNEGHARSRGSRESEADELRLTPKQLRRQRQRVMHEANLQRKQQLDALRAAGRLIGIRVAMPYRIGLHDARDYLKDPRMKQGGGWGIFGTRVKRTRVFLLHQECASLESFRTRIREELLTLFPSLSSDPHYGCVLRDDHSFSIRASEGQPPIETYEQLLEQVFSSVPPEQLGTPGSNVGIVLEPLEELKAPSPPSVPQYFLDLAARAQHDALHPEHQVQTISFYRFVDVRDPEELVRQIRMVWSFYGVKGRIYVAREGINAQFCVPVVNLAEFVRDMGVEGVQCAGEADQATAEAFEYYAMPHEIRGVFLNKDTRVSYSESAFQDLRIKTREKVLQDGLDDAIIEQIDWKEHNGTEIEAQDWHRALVARQNGSEPAMVLDCRNRYESEVGLFEGAIALDTDTFRDTWQWLETQLKDTDKNAPILTYCTGGIRCVKVGAYLEQKMGFTNVKRLKGGIVSYSRMLRENPGYESMFKGVNFVFDLRIGERLSADVLAKCDTCGVQCDTQTDCANVSCNRPFNKRLFVQCPDCAARMQGCCSEACRTSVSAAKARFPLASSIVAEGDGDNGMASMSHSGAELERDTEYAQKVSKQQDLETDLLSAMQAHVSRAFASRTHMMSGSLQGQYLHSVVRMIGASSVLELGTFTGYGTLCLASAVPNGQGMVVTVERDEEVASTAASFFQQSTHKDKITLMVTNCEDALAQLASESKSFDLVYMDANKKQYKAYYDLLLDKKLVKSGGWIAADNTLFRGLVKQYGEESKEMQSSRTSSSAASMSVKDALHLRRSRSVHQAQKIAAALHDFNVYVRNDSRTDSVLLPIRDGLTLIRVR